MSNILYLGHRLPYPLNKGEKLASYNLLKYLGARHTLFIGTFVDDPEDEPHVETIRAMCAELHVSRLTPRYATLRSAIGLLTGEALSLHYYQDKALQDWVRRTLDVRSIDVVVAFSGVMAQFVDPRQVGRTVPPVILNFADVDSAKFTQYATTHRWPMSWVYAREGRKLLDFERAATSRSLRALFVTEKEVDLFRGLAPECAGKVGVMGNGVDSDYFAPDPTRASPYDSAVLPVVFTGAMDYWPNVDAVVWFAQEVLPALRQKHPTMRLYIVGRNPAPAVQALAGEAVVVTGTVPDVRPYLQHAAAVVAPLRVARGIQNKVLEAMAMARPVVAAQSCVEAIDCEPGRELVPAVTADDFAQQVDMLVRDVAFADVIGQAGRACVLRNYSWAARLSCIDPYLEPAPAGVVLAEGRRRDP